MSRLLLLVAVLACAACSGGPVAPTVGVSVSRAGPGSECVPPPYNHTWAFANAPATVERAHLLINKMWGTWPKPPACVATGTCHSSIPATCNETNCATFSCFGWTCQMTAIAVSPTGSRVATTVAGPPYIETQFALQPAAGQLTALETTELTGIREASVPLDASWCE